MNLEICSLFAPPQKLTENSFSEKISTKIRNFPNPNLFQLEHKEMNAKKAKDKGNENFAEPTKKVHREPV